MTNIFPWQTDLWTFFVTRYQKNRLPQAFLFEGMKGIGKSNFASAFAEFLLCQEKDFAKSCGHCRSCALLKTEFHPDLISVAAEGSSQIIKIDQIRNLNERITKTAHFKGYRVVIIAAAHNMNQAASNALLKTIEEPPSQTIFILLTDSPHRVSATLRSRCEKMIFPQPSIDEVNTWLKANLSDEDQKNYPIEFLSRLAGQGPLETLAFIKNANLVWREKIIADFSAVILKKLNPLSLAEKYKTLPLEQLFFWLETITADLIRLKMGTKINVLHVDQVDLFKTIAAHLTISKLYAYLDKLYVLNDQVARGLNLNHGLVVDEVFLEGTI